jgi:predicted nucleotidyltransferase
MCLLPTAVARRLFARATRRGRITTMDLTPYVENVRRCTAELKRRNAEAQARARADLPKLVEVLRSHPSVRRAYLYGSLAKGTFHPRSDIDIAVEGPDERETLGLQRTLAALTEFPVDVRDLDSTPEFRELVEFYGEVLHAER